MISRQGMGCISRATPDSAKNLPASVSWNPEKTTTLSTPAAIRALAHVVQGMFVT